MAIFCYNEVKKIPRLPQLFRDKRITLGFEIESIKHTTPVSSRYLHALEDGRFEKLPQSKTYRLGYVRSYAEMLGLPVEQCVNQFVSEGGLENITFTHPHTRLKLFPFKSWSLLVRNIFIGSFVVIFIGYLFWQVKTIITPPELSIFFPNDGFVTKENLVTIQGKTEPGAHLTVNGQDISFNGQGQFSLPLDLTPGLNSITFASQKKHGKTTSKTISVILRPDILPTVTPTTKTTP